MKTLIGMLIVGALATPALAKTMDQFRPEFMNEMLQSCLAGDAQLSAFNRDPSRCACYAGKLAENMTMSDAVTLSNGIAPADWTQRTYNAARACL